MKFKKINLIFLVIVFVGVLAWAIHEDGVDNLANMFLSLNPFWLVGALLFIGAYWLLEAGILHDVLKAFHPSQKFRNSLTTSMIGQLFNCITPFSSGGQPMQAYHMVKTGVPLGISGSVLMIKFIIYQFCLTLYSIVVLIFYWYPFSQKVSGFGYLVFIGFTINFAVMLGLISVCFFRRFTRAMVGGLISLLHKIRIVKDKEKTLSYIDAELEEFHTCFLEIKKHKIMVLKASLLSIFQLTAFYLISYFILLSFGVVGTSPVMVIAAQAFVSMITSFVPLPGAAGGAEFSFKTFFSPFFPAGMSVNLPMLLWRMITFYLPILVGMLFLLKSGSPKEVAQADEMSTKVSQPDTAR